MFETLNESPLTQWLNSLLWGFPAAEIFHIVMTGGFSAVLPRWICVCLACTDGCR